MTIYVGVLFARLQYHLFSKIYICGCVFVWPYRLLCWIGRHSCYADFSKSSRRQTAFIFCTTGWHLKVTIQYLLNPGTLQQSSRTVHVMQGECQKK